MNEIAYRLFLDTTTPVGTAIEMTTMKVKMVKNSQSLFRRRGGGLG